MVEIFPTLEFIKEMKPQPTAGENYLLTYLNNYLRNMNGNFEVYYQPHWDDSLPDIVIVRKNHGVLIIEVKDWNLELYRTENEKTWCCTHPNGGGAEQIFKSPIAQVNDYKNLFYNTYSRTLAEKNFNERMTSGKSPSYSIVTSAVFFYGSTESQVEDFFLGRKPQYTLLLTQDKLEHEGLTNFKELNFFMGNRQSYLFNDEIYEEIQRVLKPSAHSRLKVQLRNIQLSSEQRKFAVSAPNDKKKVRGPAGCGKTMVLAKRAISAYLRTEKPVLILTFNITLRHYIRDYINLFLDEIPNIQGRKKYLMSKIFIIRHFHFFIKTYRNNNNQFDKTKIDERGKKSDTYQLEDTPTKYQTILVDETQDYEYAWMQTIFKLLDENGEIVFFGDKDQDIYERDTFDSVPNIPGRWNELKGTYRLNSNIAQLARDFQIKFFDGSKGNEITPMASLFDESTIDYIFFEMFEADKIVEIFKDVLKEFDIQNDDICISSQVIRGISPVDKRLRDLGYKTLTTFEKEEDYQLACEKFGDDTEKINNELNPIRRTAKFAFNMESGKIKLSTIHSYKGWGIDTEILIIARDLTGDSPEFLNEEMVYTGITRAIKHLIIVNIGQKDYDNFFKEKI